MWILVIILTVIMLIIEVTINVDELKKNVYSATGDGGTLIYKFDSSGINPRFTCTLFIWK
ncbi:MAG: hypothetical protein R2942_10380 [Ignavibacteria bacterium]